MLAIEVIWVRAVMTRLYAANGERKPLIAAELSRHSVCIALSSLDPHRGRSNCPSMKTALVIGASGGIGAAVADHLESDGVRVTRLSRSADGFDATDPASVEKHLDGLGPFDLVFVAIGILAPEGEAPEKQLPAITADNMARTFAVNALGPALVLRHASKLLDRRSDGVLAVLSARVGSIGDNQIGGWYSYRASKAALNQIVHGAAIELGRSHKQATIVTLHPGTVETPFTEGYADRHKTVTAPEAAKNLINVVRSLTSEQSGQFFDYAGESISW